MKLQEKLYADLKQAMLNKDENKKTFLRVVLAEFSRIGKELSDEEVIKVLKKMKENAIIMKNDFEIRVIDSYLPKMLGEDNIKIIIATIISDGNYAGMKDMGKVMGDLKKHSNFALIDGKLASNIVKELLQ